MLVYARVYAANFLKSYLDAYGTKFLERLRLRRQNFLYALTSMPIRLGLYLLLF